MKCFAVDDKGDVVIKSGKIQLTDRKELLRQKIKTVLSTNKKEWFLNKNEGINFDNILGKKKNEDIIKNEILQGLQQIDSSFVLLNFECNFDKRNRKLVINFKAKTQSGEEITISTSY